MLVPMILLCAHFSSPEFLADISGCRYGRIIVEGNRYTPNSVVLALIRFRPGQRLRAIDICSARRRLKANFLFRHDPSPLVELIPEELDRSFVDIRVRVKDRPANACLFRSHQLALQLCMGLAPLTKRIVAAETEELLELFLAYIEWRMEQTGEWRCCLNSPIHCFISMCAHYMRHFPEGWRSVARSDRILSG